MARPMTDVRCTSSPKPSTTRPQRGSRDTSTMGEKVQVTPPERASAAARAARSRTRAGSKLADCASGTGAIVRCPWITSSPTRTGMPSRVSSTATRCSSLTAAAERGQKTEPMPSRMSCAASSRAGRNTICSCPSFSARVISASSRVTLSVCIGSPASGVRVGIVPGFDPSTSSGTERRLGDRTAARGERGMPPGAEAPGGRHSFGRDQLSQAASISSSTWSTVFCPVSRPCTPAPRAS